MICHWLNSNKIKLNVDKTEIILFRHPTKKVEYDLKIKLQGKRLRFSRSTRYLGIEIDQHLDWKQHQNNLAKKLRKANGIISKLRHYLPVETLIQIYRALFQSHVDYALQVWCQKICVNNRLIKLQKTAVRLITFSNPIAHSAPLFKQLKLNTLNELVFIANVKLTYQALNNLLPCALSNVLRLHYVVNNFYTRAQTDNLLKRFEVRTSTFGIHSVSYQCIKNWNKLQSHILPCSLKNLSHSQLRRKTLEFLSLQ